MHSGTRLLALLAPLLFVHAVGQQERPVARACHSSAYVPMLGGIAVFGGATECGTRVIDDDALWLWNGNLWRVVARGGPSPREDALLAYDHRRNTLVLYGGRRRGNVFRDTWEWRDGQGWRQITTATDPGPLEHAAIAFDSARGRMVVFGGAVGSALSAATWEWDGATWSRAASAISPAARVGHSQTWNPSRRAIMAYGGFSSARQFTDLWSWDGRAWTLIDGAGPTHTEGPSLVSAGERAFVVGPGRVEGTTWRLWRYANVAWNEVGTGGSYPVRVGSAAAFDAARRKIVITGGAQSGTASISVVELDVDR